MEKKNAKYVCWSLIVIFDKYKGKIDVTYFFYIPMGTIMRKRNSKADKKIIVKKIYEIQFKVQCFHPSCDVWLHI